MLLNLKTIHKPATLEGAAQLLAQDGTYPLYGGVALQRNPRPEVVAAVDLSNLGLNFIRDSDNSLRLGTMLTLEQARQACDERRAASPKLAMVADVLAREQPETLRHTMTLGDLLAERDPQSLAMTLFLALGAVLKRFDLDMHFTTAAWLATRRDVSRYLIGQLRIPRQPERAALAVEQVGRTPADAPLVGAVAVIEVYNESQPPHTVLALCGVDDAPVRQPDVARAMDETGDIDAALGRLVLNPPSDHWGSSAYRAEMARVLSRRVLERAWAEINAGE